VPQAVQMARSRLSSGGSRYAVGAPQARQWRIERGLNMVALLRIRVSVAAPTLQGVDVAPAWHHPWLADARVGCLPCESLP